jgi:ABC-type polysaccharide/polyol phosphate transport system ATPase subunit
MDGVYKHFRILHRESSVKAAVFKLLIWQMPRWEDFRALEDITFTVPKGQTVGVVGRNGSGKSTLLSMLARIYRPTRGRITVRGRIASLLALEAGFQPEFTGHENIFLNGVIYGLTRDEIQERLDDITRFADIGSSLTQQVKYYSSGMKARLGFAVAVHVDPDVLLVDEVLAVGDLDFQDRCYEKIEEFKKRGVTIFFVSHDLAAVRRVSDRVIWIDEHRVRMDGPADEVLAEYAKAMHQHAHEIESAG